MGQGELEEARVKAGEARGGWEGKGLKLAASRVCAAHFLTDTFHIENYIGGY